MRTRILAVALSLATLVAVPVTAFAAPRNATSAKVTHGDKDQQFPMKGSDFKAKVDGRLAKARERMEKRVAKLDAEKAKETRAKFDAGAAKVNAEVGKAIADGTVTQEEAKSVHHAMREMHPNKGKHARHHRGEKKDGGARGEKK
jgi:hypothetical protein